MIAVPSWYNPYTTVRDVDMVVSFDAVSETASSNVTYSTSDQESISNLSQLNADSYEEKKYATCENDFTMLDGTYKYLPDTLTATYHIGWWSNMVSNGDGDFLVPPKLTATLSEYEDCVGFTIYSSRYGYITECIVTVYEDTTLVYSEIFSSDSPTMTIDLPAENFNKVEIEVIKTNLPYRRVKLLGFKFGIVKSWNRNEIVSANITEEADIISSTLPINELSVEFDNSNGDFDLFGGKKKYVYRKAAQYATVIASHENLISKRSQIMDDILTGYNYATCENGLVLLDGTYKYLPSGTIPNSYQIGFLNDKLSNVNREYTNYTPELTYKWDEKIDISGLRLYFGKYNYASELEVYSYRDDTLIAQETFYNDSEVVELDYSVSECNMIIIKFVKGADEYREIKLFETQFLKYADSWASYLTKNQKIRVEYIINGVSVSMGNHYMFDKLEQTNGGLTAKITAKDYIAKLNEQKYLNAAHGSIGLISELGNILSGTGIEVVYEPASLINVIVSKSAPKDTTKRAAIHYFTQAACATCALDRSGNLKVRSFDITPYVDTIDINSMYNEDVLRLNDYINMIRLTVKDEYTDPATENTYFGGSGLYYREIENDCVYTENGQAVADWLLTQSGRRVYFEVQYRGNPALELGDTVRIRIKNGTSFLGVIYYQNFEYNGGLESTLRAVVGEPND